MAVLLPKVLDVLRAHGILPLGDDLVDLPGIGEIMEGETVYTTSTDEIFRLDDDSNDGKNISEDDDPRLIQLYEDIGKIIQDSRESLSGLAGQGVRKTSAKAPEPICAWYCPIHYFGYGWGIYIRESCIFSHAIEISKFVDWRSVHASIFDSIWQLLRSSFYFFFLHEQFHHKVESLGFRLLVARGRDCYKNYKTKVYRKNFLTPDCLEESIANAEIYRRLNEQRYVQRVDAAIRAGLRDYFKYYVPKQPPGYAEGVNFLTETNYRKGIYNIQSQMLDGVFPPKTPVDYWSVAPNMITALTDITDDIYVVLPVGAKPIFRPTSIDPAVTVSSRALGAALEKHYGYRSTSGGKGSHMKFEKSGVRPIILPGNRPVLSPGVVKEVLNTIGRYPISRLPDFLEGRLLPSAGLW